MVKHEFRGCSGSCSQNGLFFFHNENVVNTGLSFPGITYILKVSRHIFLAVHVIRPHLHAMCAVHRHFHDLSGIFKRDFLIFVFEQIESRRTLQCKGMDRQGIRVQRLHFFQGMRHFFPVLARQTNDQIHVDVVETKVTRHAELLFNLLHRMMASDQIQCLLVHRLRVNRNTSHREFADGL